MKTLLLTALLGIFALAASAADVTGKWMAQVPGRNGNQDVTFNLKQAGSALTGTVTTGQGDQQIAEGTVNGDNISFKVSFEARGNQVTQNYKGTVSGSEIKFTRDGGRGPIEFTAKKQ
jgi:opacity protein-like surface antigen